MTKTPKRQPSASEKDTIVDTMMMYYPEVVDGKTRKKPVLLIRIPVCQLTKNGFTDTVENFVARPGITVMKLSSSTVAVIPDKSFVRDQVAAILQTVIRYRELDSDNTRIRRLPSSSPVAKQLRRQFCDELAKAHKRAGAGALPFQLAT